MRIALLTTRDTWFVPYIETLHHQLKNLHIENDIFFEHEYIDDSYKIVCILSYHRLIEQKYLKLHQHNIVIHASNLPQGKGWAPLFWQVLEAQKEITFTLFEAGNGADNGDVYLRKNLTLNGYELNPQLRKLQAQMVIEMTHEFLNNYHNLHGEKQKGIESFYPKRSAKDSMLDVNKTIKEQFNLLRIVDNENFPAYFEIDGHRYTLKIEHDTREEI